MKVMEHMEPHVEPLSFASKVQVFPSFETDARLPSTYTTRRSAALRAAGVRFSPNFSQVSSDSKILSHPGANLSPSMRRGY